MVSQHQLPKLCHSHCSSLVSFGWTWRLDGHGQDVVFVGSAFAFNRQSLATCAHLFQGPPRQEVPGAVSVLPMVSGKPSDIHLGIHGMRKNMDFWFWESKIHFDIYGMRKKSIWVFHLVYVLGPLGFFLSWSAWFLSFLEISNPDFQNPQTAV